MHPVAPSYTQQRDPSTLTHQHPDDLRPRFLSAVRLEEVYLTTAGHTCTLLNSQISKELSDIAERCLRPHDGEFQMVVTQRCFGVEAADEQERRVLCKCCSGCNILFKQPTRSSTFQNPHRKSSCCPVNGMIGRLLWANIFFLFLQLLNFVFIFTSIVFWNYFGFNLFLT